MWESLSVAQSQCVRAPLQMMQDLGRIGSSKHGAEGSQGRGAETSWWWRMGDGRLRAGCFQKRRPGVLILLILASQPQKLQLSRSSELLAFGCCC